MRHQIGQLNKFYFFIYHFRGTFSIVKYAINKHNGQAFAVKIIDKKRSFWQKKKTREHIEQEVNILKRIRHPNIINFYEIYKRL